MNTAAIAIKIVQDFIVALENNDRARAGSYLADHFLFSGWTPKPLHKEAFLNVIGGLKAGFPNLSFNLRHLRQRNEWTVSGNIQASGTQTDEFNLPELSLPPIPETDGHITLPTEEVTFEINDGQITHMAVTPIHNGGIQGMLRQLGIEVPILQ